ncbi:MAG: hypothetical protein ABIY52_02510 [Gemmatimonadaceae bacterium]
MAYRPALAITILMFAAGCNRAPARQVALEAIRAAHPRLETATVVDTVWKDGPPWFSCAEVLSKITGRADTAVVRNEVGNWRSLLLADWISLRDTFAAPVAEPGWCTASVHDSLPQLRAGWQEIHSDSLPSGGRRRGWAVAAGQHRVVVREDPRSIGSDSAEVSWLLTLAPNENGKALGADRDSLPRRAVLVRVDGRWVAQ